MALWRRVTELTHRNRIPFIVGCLTLIGFWLPLHAAAASHVLRVRTVAGGFPHGVNSAAADPVTGHTFITSENRVAMVDTATATVQRTVTLPASYGNVFVDSRRGRVLIYGSTRGSAPVWVCTLDTRSGALLHIERLRGMNNVAPSALDEDTGRLFIADRTAHDSALLISVLDTRSGRIVRSVTVPGSSYVTSLVVDVPHRRVAALALLNNSARLYLLDAATGAIVGTVSPDVPSDSGLFLTIDEADGQVFVPTANGVMAVSTMQVVAQHMFPLAGLGALAVLDQPAHTLITLGSGVARFYSLPTGAFLHATAVPDLALNPLQLLGVVTGTGFGRVAVDSSTGHLYLPTRSTKGAYGVGVYDGAGHALATWSLRQAGTDAALSVDTRAQRLVTLILHSDYRSGFVDVDVRTGALISSLPMRCPALLPDTLPVVLDPTSHVIYCVDQGPMNHDQTVLTGAPGVVYAWDSETGHAFSAVHIHPYPRPVAPIGTTGQGLILQGDTVTIVSPAR